MVEVLKITGEVLKRYLNYARYDENKFIEYDLINESISLLLPEFHANK